MTLALRSAELTDVDGLVACIDRAYAKYLDRLSGLPAVSEGIDWEIEHNQVWVACEDEKIVGCVFLVAQEDHLKLVNLAVDPAHGGKGIGRQLMELAEREAARQGFSEMQLATHADMLENVALYAHWGWHEVSRTGKTVLMRMDLVRA